MGIPANLKLLFGQSQLLCKIRPELLWQSMPFGFSLPVLRLFQKMWQEAEPFMIEVKIQTQCCWVDKAIQVHETPSMFHANVALLHAENPHMF